MRNWEELLPDLLDHICNFISVLEDFTSFGGVCAMWRRVEIQHNRGHPFRPLPYLMLAEEDENKDHRDFYSLADEKIYKLMVPELKGKKCMETKGWLVTASLNGEMSLVQLVTRQQIRLPDQNTSKHYHEFMMDNVQFVRRAVLSSRNPNSSDCVLMVIHGSGFHLGFCKPGDEVWTVIEDREAAFQAIEFYRGKFYAADCKGNIWECDMLHESSNSNPVTMRIIGRIPLDLIKLRQIYLVESDGHLLIVIRDGVFFDDEDTNDYGASEFKVFEFDVVQGSLKEVDNLGSRSIFLGYSASLSIETRSYPKLCSNSIYYTDDCFESHFPMFSPEGGGKDMGIYNLSDKTIRPHYGGKSLSHVCPPVWTFLDPRIERR